MDVTHDVTYRRLHRLLHHIGDEVGVGIARPLAVVEAEGTQLLEESGRPREREREESPLEFGGRGVVVPTDVHVRRRARVAVKEEERSLAHERQQGVQATARREASE